MTVIIFILFWTTFGFAMWGAVQRRKYLDVLYKRNNWEEKFNIWFTNARKEKLEKDKAEKQALMDEIEAITKDAK